MTREQTGRKEHLPLRIAPDSFLFTVLLGLFAALPALSIDVSSPTLQLLPHALGTTTMMAGLSLSLFMVGFALGQFGGGTISDRRGRRPVLLGGLGCYTIASVACALAFSGITLAIFRCLEGLGAGACSVLSFAIVQDLFVGDAARTKRSYVTVVFAVVPMAAPAIGALLAGIAGWRAIYAALTICGAGLLLITWMWLPESRQWRPATPSLSAVRVRLWRDHTFIGLTITNALSYGAIFAYIAGAPVVIIGQLGLTSAVFSGVFASTAVALTAGAWTSGYLGRRHVRAQRLLGPSLMSAAIGAAALEATIGAHVPWPAALLPPLIVVMFARGVTAPNLQHLAIERRRKEAGAASAVLGVSQLVAGASSSAVVAGLLPAYGSSAIAIPMASLTVLALLCWWATLTLSNAQARPERQ